MTEELIQQHDTRRQTCELLSNVNNWWLWAAFVTVLSSVDNSVGVYVVIMCEWERETVNAVLSPSLRSQVQCMCV